MKYRYVLKYDLGTYDVHYFQPIPGVYLIAYQSESAECRAKQQVFCDFEAIHTAAEMSSKSISTISENRIMIYLYAGKKKMSK